MTPKPIAPIAQATARAFVYLRVSSEGQVRTDYSDDGLSIDAQREGAEEKAVQLEANIVREYSDPGRSAYVDLHKRTGFLEMLDELKRRNEHASTRVEYVVVWALNRWARNQRDHWRRAVGEFAVNSSRDYAYEQLQELHDFMGGAWVDGDWVEVIEVRT